jgi:2'-5' RNA ligase
VNDEQKPLRLFVAASLPESELIRIDAETKDLRDRLVGARWAPIENQHVTLKFLGATRPERLGDVEEIVAAVAAAYRPAELSVEGLGVFPSVRRARVLWASVRDEVALMSSLAAEMADSFAAMGYKPEKRKFTPHLTLARFRQPVPVEKDRLQLERGAPFRLEGIDLFRSQLSPKGARYELLRTFDLGTGK